MRKNLAVSFLIWVIAISCTSYAGMVTTDFESGMDGWSVYSDGSSTSSFSLESNAGPDGSTALLLNEEGSGLDYLLAPSKFLGNLTTYDSFEFDMKTDTSPSDYYLDVWFQHTDESTEYKYSFGSVGTTAWQSYSVDFTQGGQESGWSQSSGSKSWQDTMENVGRLRVDVDLQSIGEDTYVDNISLIPEPASVAMLAVMSGLGLFIRRWFLA